MRRLRFACALLVTWYPAMLAAQPPPAQPPENDQQEDEPLPEELEDDEGDEPSLRPPAVDQLQIQGVEGEEDVSDDDFPSPGDAAEELEEAAPPSSDPTRVDWTAPQPVLTLHGYFRVRSELWDTFWLGRDPGYLDGADPPFDRFLPIDRRGAGVPMGGCGEMGSSDSTSECDSETIGFANMRLRLEPTISLSEDVRVHAQFDVLDNLVLGSTPDGLVTTPTSGDPIYERVERTPRVPLDSFTTTVVPPQRYRNSLSDSIVARRAWAEVTNRGLGQLRFGRMGSHWGLGLLANGGEGIDADFQSDADRIMAITKLAGFYFVGAWDFANEGYINQNLRDPQALAYDMNQEDDVDQYVFAVARRMEEEQQRAALQRGELVLNGGIYFVYRNQLLSGMGIPDFYGAPPSIDRFVRRDAEAFIPDVWVQLLWGSLRVEAELVLIAGTIENTQTTSFSLEEYDVLQFGGVLEVEYRLLDDKLGIYFDTGLATGDQDVEGLAVTAGLPAQTGGDRTISTFRFHPNYRIDLILWRNIMQQVAGAYYFKPGLSYDFIRNSFGQLFGARADVVWSRATSPVQTWGNDPDLGLEINARLYYRSEDGPELIDGFYGSLEYGILFPLGGLGYLTRNGVDDRGVAPPDLENAQILRLVLGVQY